MSTPDEHLSFQYAELNKLTEQLRLMRGWGVSELDPGFLRLFNARGAAMGKLGLKLPRLSIPILKLLGLSPGELTLWADAEMGWVAEARERPGAPPVYKAVSDELAEKIVKGKLSHDEFELLKVPDIDIDN